VPRYDVPKAAPEPLRLVQLLVNTVDREHGREWLGSVADLAAWLHERGLPDDGVDEAELERALALREALRSLLQANGGGPVDPDAVAELNAFGACARLDERGRLTFHADGAAVGPVLAVALGAMVDGTWSRLKVCRQCSWAFYDYSRNRAATWCSMTICGNRLKTRAYRRRRTTS
jgi:predicted RNA-binding Zn ribbon-like protein